MGTILTAKDEDDELEGIAKATDEVAGYGEISEEFIAKVMELNGETRDVTIRQIQEWLATEDAAEVLIANIREHLNQD